MKAISLIIGVCIVIMMMAAVLASIQLFRGAEYVEPHNVTTGSGETGAEVTLTQDLLDGSTAHVSMTSNVTEDAPIPASYVASSRVLSISGLLPDETRKVTITYEYNQLTVYWAADLVCRMWPVLLGIGILGIIGASVYAAARPDELS